MKKRDLLMIGLVLALSLPLNVWAATTLGESLSVDDGGSPDTALGAGDAYIEGGLEVDGDVRFDGDFTFLSTDGSVGPVKVFYHNDSSPANAEGLGQLLFKGKDSLGNDTDYAIVAPYIQEVTDGSEAGGISFNLAQGTDGGTYLSGILQTDGGSSSVSLALGDPTMSGYVDGSYSSFGQTTISSGNDGNIDLAPEGSGVIVANGGYATPYDSVTGPGAISLDRRVTTIATTGADAYTLADGVEDGQRIEVACVNHVGDGTLTPTTTLGFTSITFDGAGQSVSLMWFEGAGWAVVDTYGVTVNP